MSAKREGDKRAIEISFQQLYGRGMILVHIHLRKPFLYFIFKYNIDIS